MSIISKIRKNGLSKSWKYFKVNILGIYTMKFHYILKDLDQQEIEKQMEGFDLQPKRLTYEDFLKGDPTEFNESRLAGIKEHLENPSYKAWGIIENGVLIYSTWISTINLDMPLKHQKYKLQPDEGLLDDSYCHPSARGRGIHSKMNKFRLLQLCNEGKHRAAVIVLDGNTTSLNVQLKAGFREVATFRIINVFGKQFVTLKKVL